ncbi:hypothetical protein GOBAR_AA21002 [Gossypium barbadense]|uniref:Uncharacterized protein n=1 Tax=Gossypium barbadense TaxID=3634 RepID=A0A2P5X8L2_GOSBA|nr:hypothetical protein GOBAR_AA21002 [Gossypium barbadense]
MLHLLLHLSDLLLKVGVRVLKGLVHRSDGGTAMRRLSVPPGWRRKWVIRLTNVSLGRVEEVPEYPTRWLNGFRDCIMDCHLSKPQLVGSEFTWERGRGADSFVMERLDRAFMNSNWTQLFPLFWLFNLTQLNSLLAQQTVYWRQRSKVLWLSQGEANTRCFHSRASKCRRVNQVTMLLDESGSPYTNDECMYDIVARYFQELFSASTSTDYLAFNDFAPWVGDAQYMALLAPFEAWEFKEAIMSMHPDKAARPDGLNPAFSSDVGLLSGVMLRIVLGWKGPSVSHMPFANEVELKDGYYVIDPVKSKETVDESTICVAVFQSVFYCLFLPKSIWSIEISINLLVVISFSSHLASCPTGMENELAVLSLNDEENEILQIPRDPLVARERELYLVGCFLTTSLIHFPVMKTVQLGNFLREFLEYDRSDIGKENRNYMRIRAQSRRALSMNSIWLREEGERNNGGQWNRSKILRDGSREEITIGKGGINIDPILGFNLEWKMSSLDQSRRNVGMDQAQTAMEYDLEQCYHRRRREEEK